MVSTSKDPITFDTLMATSIDFSKFVLNGLKIDNLTQDLLLGHAYNLLKEKLDCNNPEGDHYPFDLSKPLLLQEHQGRQIIAVDYFFNNDLEYLKSSDPTNTYTTSITKIKATWYEIFEDSWCEKCEEGDFVNLHLNDIEVMLLLSVQHKLFHLNNSDIVDLTVALRMFTRSLIVKRRVEDLQLGVERVVNEDQNQQKRVMRADELYKFSDGTLLKVQDKLPHRVRDFQQGYNTEMHRRKWSEIDKKRSRLMVELIDKQMRERRIIQNLKLLVGARELEMDYKMMTRTI
ncbi:hypothetical protein Tco_1466749 [Tanacetum coccineum]